MPKTQVLSKDSAIQKYLLTHSDSVQHTQVVHENVANISRKELIVTNEFTGK